MNFILEQTGSGPKSRSPSVPLSPISIPLAISSTLALAAPTFPFTLSASWLREKTDLQKLSRAKTLIQMINGSPEKLISLRSCLSNLRWQGCSKPRCIFFKIVLKTVVLSSCLLMIGYPEGQSLWIEVMLTLLVDPVCSPPSRRMPPTWRWRAEQKILTWQTGG